MAPPAPMRGDVAPANVLGHRRGARNAAERWPARIRAPSGRRPSAVAEGVVGSERDADDCERRAKLALDERGVDAQYADAIGRGEVAIARAVLLASLAMTLAVELDDEPPRGDEEVRDEGMQRMLPPHAHPELLLADRAPEDAFARSRILAVLPREVDEREERRAVVSMHALPRREN